MPRPAVIISGSMALLLLIGAGVAVAEFFLVVNRADDEVAILNRAKETISQGGVRAFGQRYSFRELAVGKTASITISARGEGGYIVDVLFQSGRKLSSDEYYLVHRLRVSDMLEVQDDKIIIVKREVK